MHIRVHRFLPFTRVEGPGDRACLWVQGCPVRCPGCAVPWTWPEQAGIMVSVAELTETILKGPRIEGITFVGGEPFAQAAQLASLGQALRSAGLSVVTFTGYYLEELLDAHRSDWQELLSITDLLVDGPFRADLLDTTRPWVGSKNQRFHFLTDRYAYLKTTIAGIPNRLEVRIHRDGQVLVNGMTSCQELRDLFGPLMVSGYSVSGSAFQARQTLC